MDTASSLERESRFGLRRFEVCDNVDLETVLMEYESFYFVKFQKYPKLTKKLSEQGGCVELFHYFNASLLHLICSSNLYLAF